MMNVKKFKDRSISVIALILCVTTIYSAPTVSKDIVTATTQREVSTSYNRQVECLAQNIYHEAATESYEGKLAVAQVTLNRAKSPSYPKDICAVVYQKTKSPQQDSFTCQFSWTCLSNSMKPKDKYSWEESVNIAKRALTEPQLHDRIAESNALYYHATYVNPGWNKTKVVTKIGNHIFYTKI